MFPYLFDIDVYYKISVLWVCTLHATQELGKSRVPLGRTLHAALLCAEPEARLSPYKSEVTA